MFSIKVADCFELMWKGLEVKHFVVISCILILAKSLNNKVDLAYYKKEACLNCFNREELIRYIWG